MEPEEWGEPGEKVWIVYPILPNGSGWSDWELRLSLRSVAENWQGDLAGVIILSERRPAWVSDEVGFRLAPNYRDALDAASKLGGRVVWMNDDLAFLKKTGTKDLEVPRQQGMMGWLRMVRHERSGNGWRRRKGKAARWCLRRGRKTWD